MKMLPNWSLHLTETHGVTVDRVLRTQNICQFVALGETKLFSCVNVNSKSHICVHALWWPLLLPICLVLFGSHGTASISLFFILCSGWARCPHVYFYYHTTSSLVLPAGNTLLFQISSKPDRILTSSSGIMPPTQASSLISLNIDQHWHGLFFFITLLIFQII